MAPVYQNVKHTKVGQIKVTKVSYSTAMNINSISAHTVLAYETLMEKSSTFFKR